SIVFFFIRAGDGIRDRNVTGVQTCALPIFDLGGHCERQAFNYYALQNFDEEKAFELFPSYPENKPEIIGDDEIDVAGSFADAVKIGRASCRERGWRWGVDGWYKEKMEDKEK